MSNQLAIPETLHHISGLKPQNKAEMWCSVSGVGKRGWI